MKQKVLLTGAAGFIGAEVARQLLEQNYDILALDNMNNYYDPKLKDYRCQQLKKTFGDRFNFIQLDIEDKKALQEVFKAHKFDAVINLAARAGVRYSLENPYVYMTTNAMGTLNLLELMKDFNVKKFVLASTSSLYAGAAMPFEESKLVNRPLSPYAVSKLAAETMAYSYHHLYGIDVTVLRYFTVYGPAGRPDMGMFRFIKWIDEGAPIDLFGDGTQARDFTYVSDIARGTILAMKPLGYEIINLGGGNNPVLINDVISRIEKVIGKKSNVINKPFHQADVKETWASIEKAERLLGWKPTVTLDEGIANSVKWYCDNRKFTHTISIN